MFNVGDTVYFFPSDYADIMIAKEVLAVSESGRVSVEMSQHKRPVYSADRYFATIEDCKAYRESQLRMQLGYHQANIERIEKRIQKVQSL